MSPSDATLARLEALADAGVESAQDMLDSYAEGMADREADFQCWAMDDPEFAAEVVVKVETDPESASAVELQFVEAVRDIHTVRKIWAVPVGRLRVRFTPRRRDRARSRSIRARRQPGRAPPARPREPEPEPVAGGAAS